MKAKESVINICDHMDVIAEAGETPAFSIEIRPLLWTPEK